MTGWVWVEVVCRRCARVDEGVHVLVSRDGGVQRHHKHRVKDLLQGVRRAGWKQRGDEFFCPECKKLPDEELQSES